MKTLTDILFSLFVILLTLAISGIALSDIWSWHIVPIFDLPEISAAQACAIILMVRFTIYNGNNLPKDRNVIDTVLNIVVTVIFVYFIGYLLTFLI